MEDPVIIIGCDPAARPDMAATVIRGKNMKLLIIDDIGLHVGESLHKLLLDQANRIANNNLEMLEDLVFGVAEQLPPIDECWPVKAQAEVVIPEHDPHPKAKAKLPFYHQRRRY